MNQKEKKEDEARRSEAWTRFTMIFFPCKHYEIRVIHVGCVDSVRVKFTKKNEARDKIKKWKAKRKKEEREKIKNWEGVKRRERKRKLEREKQEEKETGKRMRRKKILKKIKERNK